MASAKRINRRRIAKKVGFSQATSLLLKDRQREAEGHADIDAFKAPSECHAWIEDHDPDKVLRAVGRSEKWWRREAGRRGLSDKWCYANGLPYPRTSKAERDEFRKAFRF